MIPGSILQLLVSIIAIAIVWGVAHALPFLSMYYRAIDILCGGLIMIVLIVFLWRFVGAGI